MYKLILYRMSWQTIDCGKVSKGEATIPSWQFFRQNVSTMLERCSTAEFGTLFLRGNDEPNLHK